MSRAPLLWRSRRHRRLPTGARDPADRWLASVAEGPRRRRSRLISPCSLKLVRLSELPARLRQPRLRRTAGRRDTGAVKVKLDENLPRQLAQRDRRTGVRSDQAGAWLPTIPVAGIREGARGMVVGLHDAQCSQAVSPVPVNRWSTPASGSIRHRTSTRPSPGATTLIMSNDRGPTDGAGDVSPQ